MRQFQWIPLASQDIRRKVPIAFFVSPHRTLRRLLPAIGADDFCPSARTARSQIGTGCNRLNVESLPGTIPTAILKKVRPLAARLVSGERGRLVFSSSGDPIRATGTKVAARDRSLVSTLVFSVSGAAESLFATLSPSHCRLCGTHLVDIYRLRFACHAFIPVAPTLNVRSRSFRCHCMRASSASAALDQSEPMVRAALEIAGEMAGGRCALEFSNGARNPVSNQAQAASAAGKHLRGFWRGNARADGRPECPGGGRGVYRGHDSFRMGTFCSGRRIQEIRGNGGANP